MNFTRVYIYLHKFSIHCANYEDIYVTVHYILRMK